MMALRGKISGLPDGLRAFLRWWGRTLASMVPRRLREVRRGACLDVTGDTFRLVRAGRERATGSLSGDGARLGHLRRWDLVVGGDADILWRTATVPSSAGPRLSSVVSYSLHRLTPFHRADVYFACRPLRPNHESGTTTVAVGVLRKDVVRRIVAATGADEGPARVWLRDHAGTALPALSEEASPARAPKRLPLLAATVCLTAVVTVGILADQRMREEDRRLEDALAEARQRSEVAARLEARLEAARLRAGLAAQRRLATPLAIDILDRLTRRLPDGFWLDSLDLGGGKIRVSGTGPSAVAALNLLAADAGFSDAAFAAPVTPAPEGGERFAIVARIEGDGQ